MTGASNTILMIHGYTDTCSVFNSVDKVDPGSSADTVVHYLENRGFSQSQIKTVGYYQPGRTPWPVNAARSARTTPYDDGANPSTDPGASFTLSPQGGDCTDNVRTYVGSVNDGSSACATYLTVSSGSPAPNGYAQDPDYFLSCMLAWYIYTTYTATGKPVTVLAHSMGGVLIRAALAFSGGSHQKAAFPTHPLLVSRVVTVATPHGGLSGVYAAMFNAADGSNEVKDMTVCPNLAATCDLNLGLLGSWPVITMKTGQFMKDVLAAGTPPGAANAIWMLMGSSVKGSANGTGGETSLINQLGPGPYPDTDFIVATDSQLAMDASFKILYGYVEVLSADLTTVTGYDSGGVQYQHEASTCEPIPYAPATFKIFSVTYTLPSQICAHSPYYLNDSSAVSTSAWTCPTACTNGLAGMPYTHAATPQPRALAEIARLLTDSATAGLTVGHAKLAGNDYPYDGLGQFEHQSLTDPWHEYDGQCDSFAAWKVYENLGGTVRADPATIPNAAFSPADKARSPVAGYAGTGASSNNWGDALNWGAKALSLGYAVDANPRPGSIAWWSNVNTGMVVGHVGYVTDVYQDGSVSIEGYNMRGNGQYSIIHLSPEGVDDTTFGLSAWHVVWPSGFIHIGDTAANITPQPQPAPSPGYGYPHNTFGPSDATGDFTLSGSAYPGSDHGWYTSVGHGEIGKQQWTNTHPGAADSTAAWGLYTLASNACYQLDVFVPDTYSNNSAALYLITDQHFGTSQVPVNENATTNDWVTLGVYQADGTGTMQITLTDQGQAGGQVAADAIRLIRQATCAGLKRTSLTVGLSSGLILGGTPQPNTVNGWYSDAGYGQLGTSYYTFSNGPSYSSYAQWNATLVPNSCYQVFAYVPGHRATDYQAVYTIAAGSTAPQITLDQNAYTNAFEPLGTYRTGSGGGMTVLLTDQSPVSGDSLIAADTMSFVQTVCATPSATTPVPVQGATYPALTEGPGSPLSEFAVTSDWFNRFGHGDLGYEKWTHTNGTTAGSTATWTFTTGLAANTTYQVCAVIPDNYANNTAAHYQGFQGTSSTPTFSALINQNATSGWTYLGLLNPGTTGKLTITLDDTGPTTTNGTPSYTAADAIRLSTGAC